MLVPKCRETDWNFCAEAGQRHLLEDHYHNLTRFILIRNDHRNDHAACKVHLDYVREETGEAVIETEVGLILENLFPQENTGVKLLKSKDDVMRKVNMCHGKTKIVKDFMVEDVQLEGVEGTVRRLRYKRSPHWNQAILRLSESGDLVPDVVVHPSWCAMIAGISEISHLNLCAEQGKIPRVFCVGGGTGALAMNLCSRFGFKAVVVDEDSEVSNAARCFLTNSSDLVNHLHLLPVNAILEFDKPGSLGPNYSYVHTQGYSKKFDILMVDLNSPETRSRFGICSPPRALVTERVLRAIRTSVLDQGVLIINVVSPDYFFLTDLVSNLKNISFRVNIIDIVPKQHVLVVTFSPPLSPPAVLQEDAAVVEGEEGADKQGKADVFMD